MPVLNLMIICKKDHHSFKKNDFYLNTPFLILCYHILLNTWNHGIDDTRSEL